MAREANKILKREGTFWEPEYWDTYVRDAEHLARARRYTENNPVKAKLVGESRAWPWGSARLRDARGEARAPPTAVSTLQVGAPASFTDNLYQYPLSPPAVELPIKNLFPGAEVQLALGDGHHDFTPHYLTF